MRRAIILPLIFLISGYCHAQVLEDLELASSNRNYITSSNGDNIYKIIRLNDGFLALGYAHGDHIILDHDRYDFWTNFLARFDNEGNVVWLKSIPGSGISDMVLDDTGTIYLAGSGRQETDSYQTYFLASYTLSGSQKKIKYFPTGIYGEVRSIALDSQGNAWISGKVTSRGSLLRVSINESHWPYRKIESKLHGVTVEFDDIFADEEDNIYMLIHFRSIALEPWVELGEIEVNFDCGPGYCTEFLLAKIDQDMNVLWMKSYGGAGYHTAGMMKRLKDGTIGIAGFFNNSFTVEDISFDSRGGFDGFFVNLSMEGELLDEVIIGSSDEDEMNVERITSFTDDEEGNLFLTGQGEGLVMIKEGTNLTPILNKAELTTYLLKLNKKRNLVWSAEFSGGTFDNQVLMKHDGRIMAAGGVYSESRNITIMGEEHGLRNSIAMYLMTIEDRVVLPPGDQFIEPDTGPQVIIYPNPASGKVQVSGIPDGTPVDLVDSFGRLVQYSLIKDGSLNIAELEDGVYLIRDRINGQTQRLWVRNSPM